jgi:hypothetical protein
MISGNSGNLEVWNMKKMVTSKLGRPDKFYRQPCWLDIWRHTCSDRQLTFWSRMNESNASILISYLEADGFLTRIEDCSPARLQVHSTYYSGLKSYRIKLNRRLPEMKNRQRLNTLYFFTDFQKIWMSMRILRTFSKGQLQICSDVGKDVVQTVVSQLCLLTYVRIKTRYDADFEGNEHIYQLIRDTGVKAPFLCANGILYDLNTRCIYFTD